MLLLLLSVLLGAGFLAGSLIFGVRVVYRSTERLPSNVSLTRADLLYRLSIIVPARNEESRIAALLKSLSAQSVKALEILVVDDESTDRTTSVAEKYGARVILTPPRPENWFGKTWACHTGAAEAVGDLLMFLDADVEMGPAALQQILAAYEVTGGALSVQPYHRTVHLYESFSALFNSQVVTAVGVGASSSGLFGPCIVIDKNEYYQCGGHESVRYSVLDDVDLGKSCLANGVPIRNYLGGRAVQYRMYPGGAREMCDGWTKNFLQGAGATPPWVLFLQSLWITGAVTAAVQVGLTLSGSSMALLGVFPALLVYAAYATLLALSVRVYGSFGIGVALTFPVHLLFFGFIMVRALWLSVTGGSVDWRGRPVSLHRHGPPGAQKSVEVL